MIDISSLEFISKYHVDKAFIGSYGCDLSFEVSANDEIEAKIKSLMVRNSNESFLLVDYKKFDRIGPYFQNKLEDFDYIITNSLIGINKANALKKKNKNLVIVD